MNVLIFENVDEIVECVEMRFHNANVELNESMRESIIDAYDDAFNNDKCFMIEFDVMHNAIESNLRVAIATTYANKLTHANELFAISCDVTMHVFDIVEIVDDRAHVVHTIVVDDDLNVELR